MIIGIGSDLIDIRRVEKTLARFGQRFIARIFTATERAKSERRANRAASYAKRFAAKEACSKALGTGFRRGVFWCDMGVVNLPSGKPTMQLTGGAAKRLEQMTPPGHRADQRIRKRSNELANSVGCKLSVSVQADDNFVADSSKPISQGHSLATIDLAQETNAPILLHHPGHDFRCCIL